ncbi:hypothetical protein [Shivajiella indica]|uniref:Outer membrane protein beta-barrel domain-containing protein n=1 Tax=Shivajiella indica TaxID=872115 RepID=A0ABW5BFF8_9BACT
MKTTIITLYIFLLAILGYAQEPEVEAAVEPQSQHFRVFETDVVVTKNKDGSKTWEFTSEPKDYSSEYYTKKYNPRHGKGLNFDLGINTWKGDDDAPAVKPWGSWNPAINFYYQYRASRNFHLKSTLGVSWYNFKFENRNLQALRGDEGVYFEEHPSGAGTKSKISASYLNVSVIPTLRSNHGNFTFGVGPYAGYRLGGRGKFVYNDENGNKAKEFQFGNMFASDFRYGLRAEVGVADVKLYINYDFNETFQQNKGPKVNAISFGIIL